MPGRSRSGSASASPPRSTRLDGVLVALSGFIVASGLHTISHQVDRHIGGHGSDVPTLATLTLIAVIGFTVHIIDRRSQP